MNGSTGVATWVPEGRRLHLVDIENLAGGSDAPPRTVRAVAKRYLSRVPNLAVDHVVVGAGRRMMLAAQAAFPHARLLYGRGLDGADRALMLDVDAVDISHRYDAVVIGSGDHFFAPLAEQLASLMVPVIVATRSWRSLSGDLIDVVGRDHVIVLDETPRGQTPLAAAA